MKAIVKALREHEDALATLARFVDDTHESAVDAATISGLAALIRIQRNGIQALADQIDDATELKTRDVQTP